MGVNSKAWFTGYRSGQAIALGLILLALNVTADAQTAGAIPIAFGDTVQGTLESTDPVTEDGRPIDTYVFTVPAAGAIYNIDAASPEIPLFSTLFYVNPAGDPPFIGQQVAFVFEPGQALNYSGVISQPGQYEVDVQSADPQQPTGPSGTASYTLSLIDLNAPPAAPPPPAQ